MPFSRLFRSIVLIYLGFAISLFSQDSKDKPFERALKPKDPPFADVIEGYDTLPGLFTFYRNTVEGKTYLQVLPDQIGAMFLFNATRQQGDGLHFDAGAMLGDFPFVIQRIGKRIQLIQKNVSFRADSDERAQKAINQNLPNSIIGSAKIVSAPDLTSNAVLVDCDELFLSDMSGVGFLTDLMKIPFSLDKENSWVSSLKSFPFNSEIDVTLHFKSAKPSGSYTLPDSRSMLLRFHYSIIALPKSDFKPRVADDRVGNFQTIFQDYSDVMRESAYIRYVNRWNLQKQDATATLSKPKKSITYWIENTVPNEFRPWIAEGVLYWNRAFEKIGFVDAIEVKEMPDTASWDPADIRYNVIRWMIQPGNGYAVGPSRSNPFTGEIYEADIRISADFLRTMNNEFDEWIGPLSSGGKEGTIQRAFGNSISEDVVFQEHGRSTSRHDQCRFAQGLSQQFGFGFNYVNAFLSLSPSDSALRKKYIHDYVVQLVAHEVGHTLGFRHNFKASSIRTLSQLKDSNLTKSRGFAGTVMDYTPVMLSDDPLHQGEFYQTTTGPYDDWVVEFAYAQFQVPEVEKSELARIAGRSSEPELTYATDEDCFGNSSRAIDPLAAMWDLGDNQLDYAELRYSLSKKLIQNLFPKFHRRGERYTKLRQVFGQTLGEFYGVATTASRIVGGIKTSRAHIGDSLAPKPFEIISASEQRKALVFLTTHFLDSIPLEVNGDFLNQLGTEKFEDFHGGPWTVRRPDFPIHKVIGDVHESILNRLLDPTVLARVQDNFYKTTTTSGAANQFSVDEIFNAISTSCFREVALNKPFSSIKRQLQSIFVEKLSSIYLDKNESLTPDIRSIVHVELNKVSGLLGKYKPKIQSDLEKAHVESTLKAIQAVLSAPFVRNR